MIPIHSCLAMATLILAGSLSGCQAVAMLAYDSAAQRERDQCDRAMNMQDRQTCLQRVNTAARQAEEQRRKP